MNMTTSEIKTTKTHIRCQWEGEDQWSYTVYSQYKADLLYDDNNFQSYFY